MMNLDQDSQYFLELQINTGWGQMLSSFTRWCDPQPGQFTLDVGCGPGLLPALFGQVSAHAFGIDHDPDMLKNPLSPEIANAKADLLPFATTTFDLVTASNLLYLNPEPMQLLSEMVRVLRSGGRVCLLNPSEQMTMQAALDLANQRGLEGLARETLLNYAQRAENYFRWNIDDLSDMFREIGLTNLQTTLRMGAGLVRYAKGQKP
jgi:ubiquinone/menaquinone biosynthesis C-methylase UbiE